LKVILRPLSATLQSSKTNDWTPTFFPNPIRGPKNLGPGHIESSPGGVIKHDEPHPLRDIGCVTSDRGGCDVEKLDVLEEVPRIDEEGKRWVGASSLAKGGRMSRIAKVGEAGRVSRMRAKLCGQKVSLRRSHSRRRLSPGLEQLTRSPRSESIDCQGLFLIWIFLLCLHRDQTESESGIPIFEI
jgi:hypothetical protein